MAALLGVSPPAIRQLTRRSRETIAGAGDADDFPLPAGQGAPGGGRGAAHLWTPRAIYSYILRRRPLRVDVVPRLFTPLADLNAAQFLHARTMVVRSQQAGHPGQRFVLHVWRPSDGRPPIAIAYPVSAHGDYTVPTRQAAYQLSVELFPTVSAVATPRGDAGRVLRPDLGDVVYQPAMWVADGACHDPASVLEYGWYDIANLLRVDIPWWPNVLRDEQAILAWRPGSGQQRVTPARGTQAAQPLLDVVAGAEDPAVRRTARTAATAITARLAVDARDEAELYPEHPGLIHAGVPDFDGTGEVADVGRDEAAALLHHRVADPLLADRALNAWSPRSVINTVMTIDDDLTRQSALVRRWCEGLVEVPPDRRTELGYHQLRRMWPDPMTVPTAVVSWCAHRDDPDVWAVRTGNGSVHTTVGTSVPATGGAREALITSRAAFVGTDTGAVWPMPHPSYGGYSSGFSGSGPIDLGRSLTVLAENAGAVVDSPLEVPPEVPGPLRDFIRSTPLPLHLIYSGEDWSLVQPIQPPAGA